MKPRITTAAVWTDLAIAREHVFADDILLGDIFYVERNGGLGWALSPDGDLLHRREAIALLTQQSTGAPPE